MTTKPLNPAEVLRAKTMQSAWETRTAARGKAARLWNDAATRTNTDKRIESDGTFSARDLCESALALRDAQAADVDFFSAVMMHYGDDARIRITVEGGGAVFVMQIGAERFTATIPQFPPGGRP